MADEAETTVEASATEVENAPETETPEETKEETVAEILKEPEPKQNLIPEAVFLDEKKGRKDAEKRIKELEAQIAQGATRSEVSDDIDAILTEFQLDDTNKQFFNKIASALEARADAKAEAKVAEKLKPLEEKERSEKLNQVFKTHYDKAMEQFPELEGVVNPEVIKALSLMPENANLTFKQLIEKGYSGVATGKRTIETTKPGAGKSPEPLDFEKAQRDPTYMNEVLANPDMKKAYNAELLKRI
jgi:ferritin-like metal-binding protein YciE